MKNFIVFVFAIGNICAFAQWNGASSSTDYANSIYRTGNVGIGINTVPTKKFEIRGTLDENFVFIRQDKNSGGSSDLFLLRDDRGYGGINSGTTFKVESWKGLNQQGGTLANFLTIDDGVSKSRFFIDNHTGNIGVANVLPDSKIDILAPGGGSGTSSALRIRAGNSFSYFGNTQVLFSFNQTSSYTHAIKTRHDGGNGPGNSIDFFVWKPGDAIGAVGTNHVMSLNGGKVGIGITSPTFKLDLINQVGDTDDLFRVRVNDAPDDYIKIANMTGSPGQFIPALYSRHSSDNRQAFYLTSVIGSENDLGSDAIAVFDSRLDNGSAVVRPLFAWDSYGTRKMTLSANGNLGIGTNSSSNKLAVYNAGNPTSVLIGNHTAGFTSVTIGTNADVNGYGYIQSVKTSGTAYGDLIFNGSGGKVGIGTLSPKQQLDINGGLGFANHNSLDKKLYSPTDGMLEWMTNSAAATHGFAISHQGTQKVVLNTSGHSYFVGGNLGIGTTTPDEKLTVDGTVRCEEVKVEIFTGTGPDYVFAPDYNLLPLSEVESYIKANKHLPEVPSAKQMEEEGLNLKEMNLLLLKKVEELTLHLIELDKRETEFIKKTEKLTEENLMLKDRLSQIDKMKQEIEAIKQRLK